MSFITRCPACGTAFKVVSDQLKISEGWVRCGHCTQVFDATLDLQPWWPGVETVAPADNAAEQPPEMEAPTDSGPAEAAADTEPGESTDSQSLEAVAALDQANIEGTPAHPDSEPVQPAEPELAAHGGAELNDYFEPPAPPISFQADLVEKTAPDQAAEPVAELDEADAAAESEPEAEPKPSFVREAERRAFWRRPAVQALGGVFALLLGVTLLFQMALHWREALTVRYPASATWLQQACQLAGCYAGAPRAIEQLSIDSSALLRRSAGSYAFDMVVKNAAQVDVATPALELTLTDANDQVLVRRVLAPSDWPEPRETLAPGDRAVRLDLLLDGPEAAVMTGYRAVLFYP